MGDGRAEGSSAIGDGGQAAISLTPDVDGTGSGSLLKPNACSTLKAQNLKVRDLLYRSFVKVKWHKANFQKAGATCIPMTLTFANNFENSHLEFPLQYCFKVVQRY